MEQTMGFAGDLAAKQQVAVEVSITAVLLVAAVALDHLQQRFTDQHRGVVEGSDLHQIRLLLGTDARAEQAYHALGGGQIAGGLQHQHPFPLLMENVQLFKSGNMVDARVGAGVGSKHQSIRQAHGHTVGHCGYSRIIAAAPAGCVRALQRWLT